MAKRIQSIVGRYNQSIDLLRYTGHVYDQHGQPQLQMIQGFSNQIIVNKGEARDLAEALMRFVNDTDLEYTEPKQPAPAGAGFVL